MFALGAKDRCKKCRIQRALRHCPRVDKGLCWHCCNELRVDLKCPESCPYAGKMLEQNPLPAFKADTLAEMNHAIKSFIDRWIGKGNANFGDISPKAYASSNRAEMLAWLSGFQYPDFFPLDYLMHKLELDVAPGRQIENPEHVASKYLEHIIALEYDDLRALTMNKSPLADLNERYKDILGAVPFLKKVKSFCPVHTGFSEDGGSALVFVELNYKQEWTLVLRKDAENWYVRQNLNGNPSLYFRQNELYQNIATLLANSDDQKAYFEISEALRSYVDSADLYYYRALYWLLVKETSKAKVDLFNAIALDNLFTPPYLHLGLLYLNEKNYSEARLWFSAVLDLEPDNPDAANNLAIALLAGGNKADALKIWQELLKKNPAYELARKNLELYG